MWSGPALTSGTGRIGQNSPRSKSRPPGRARWIRPPATPFGLRSHRHGKRVTRGRRARELSGFPGGPASSIASYRVRRRYLEPLTTCRSAGTKREAMRRGTSVASVRSHSVRVAAASTARRRVGCRVCAVAAGPAARCAASEVVAVFLHPLGESQASRNAVTLSQRGRPLLE